MHSIRIQSNVQLTQTDPMQASHFITFRKKNQHHNEFSNNAREICKSGDVETKATTKLWFGLNECKFFFPNGRRKKVIKSGKCIVGKLKGTYSEKNTLKIVKDKALRYEMKNKNLCVSLHKNCVLNCMCIENILLKKSRKK